MGKQSGKMSKDLEPLESKPRCFTFEDGDLSNFEYGGTGINYHVAANKLFRRTGKQFNIDDPNEIPKMYAEYFVFTQQHNNNNDFFINEKDPTQVMKRDGDSVKPYKLFVMANKHLEEAVLLKHLYFKQEGDELIRGNHQDDRASEWSSTIVNEEPSSTYVCGYSEKYHTFYKPHTMEDAMNALAQANNRVSPTAFNGISNIRSTVIITDSSNNITAVGVNDTILAPGLYPGAIPGSYIKKLPKEPLLELSTDFVNQDDNDLRNSIEWFNSKTGKNFNLPTKIASAREVPVVADLPSETEIEEPSI